MKYEKEELQKAIINIKLEIADKEYKTIPVKDFFRKFAEFQIFVFSFAVANFYNPDGSKKKLGVLDFLFKKELRNFTIEVINRLMDLFKNK